MTGYIQTTPELGAQIRARRKALGLRQEDLALTAGTGLRFLSELERGKPTAQLGPTFKVLNALGLAIAIGERPGDQHVGP